MYSVRLASSWTVRVRSVRMDAKNGAVREVSMPTCRAERANAWTTRFVLDPRSIAAFVSASSSSSATCRSSTPCPGRGASTISSATRTSA
ncbi:Uncharacterised protein [Mycobacteroides abscessus subsp. abscessus]|nr:Uncharacterised protein [Mycobacteroides abscessus subsp. abscessus]